MFIHFCIHTAFLSSIVVGATATTSKKSDGEKPLFHDNNGDLMAAARNPFVPIKMAGNHHYSTGVEDKGAKQSLRQMLTLEKVETNNAPVKTLRNIKDPQPNMSKDTEDLFNASEELGILNGSLVPNDASISHERKLGGLDCGGNYPLIGLKYPFNNVVGACLYGPSGVDDNYCFYEGPLGCWNTSQVTDMRFAFFYDYEFNEDISKWDTSKVTDMTKMFYLSSVNQPIGNWDVSSVTSMYRMFFFNKDFDQPLDKWDVSSVTDMGEMLRGTPFNRCLSTWAEKVPDNVNTVFMLMDGGCSNTDDPQPNISPWCQTADECPSDTESPTAHPTASPTAPTASPSLSPTTSPSDSPTPSPSQSPTPSPTPSPSDFPTSTLCENKSEPFFSCDDFAALPKDALEFLCDLPNEIAKNCPQLCPGDDECPCSDFILPFSVDGINNAVTCTKVAESNQKIQACNKFEEIAKNCPGVCTCE